MLRSKLSDFIRSQKEDDAISESELNELCETEKRPTGNFMASNAKNNEAAKQNFETLGKSIDFVLVYDENASRTNLKGRFGDELNDFDIRALFESNLETQGLELEKEGVNGLTFVKIHIPRPILRKYCEILKLKMPMKQYTTKEEKCHHDFNFFAEVKSVFKRFIRFFVTIDPRKYKDNNTLYAQYSPDKNYMFDDDNPSFFTPTVRMLVADFILHRTKWTRNDKDLHSVGIQTLLDQNSYKAAYPLHDGSYRQEGTLRNQLRIEWASLDKWIRLQPMDDVKEYLGVKFAFYFAWLGFYTQLLIPASIVGVMVFLYGFMSLSRDKFSSFVCSDGSAVDMCPLCDKNCGLWKLSENCQYAKITYLFSNNFTVIFAFLMSVWATFFLELWKRHAAVLTHCWGLSDYSSQSEHPRPQYLATLAGARKTKLNVDTNQREPVLSFWSYKLPTVVFSYTMVIFFMLIAVGVVLSIVFLRMAMYSADSWTDAFDQKYSVFLVPVTSGLLNLISIMLLNAIYENIATYLTSLELPRTQTEFENSLSIKLYIFQFVNYYSSMLYIAFFKGKFVGYPGKYNKIFGIRQEECRAGGCLIELSIQLAIIMVGQQILASVLEIIVPAGWRWFNHYTLKKNANQENGDLYEIGAEKQWCEDYKLLDWGTQGLFNEYLEIAMQFGFVTLFASAFPLAPLFALINNVFELRLDAQKILKYYRRPVPHQIPNIGVWYRITDVIGKMAVLFNAIIIAFSSDFIPRLVEEFEDKDNRGSLNIGEIPNFGFSKTSISGLEGEQSQINYTNNTECWYYGYREPTDDKLVYRRSLLFWKILACRLLFMFIFQNTVFFIKTAFQWLIPDVPAKLEERKKKEARLITELVIERETEMAVRKAHQGRK